MICCSCGEENGDSTTSMPVDAMLSAQEKQERMASDAVSLEDPSQGGGAPELDAAATTAQGSGSSEAAPTAPCTVKSALRFTATLKKPKVESGLGWHLDVLNKSHLYVCRLVTGQTPIEVYNKTVAPAQQVQEGDYIESINGQGVSQEMMNAMKQGEILEVVVIRPLRVVTHVQKSEGSSLGLDLKYGPGGNTLLIEGIRDGVIKQSAKEIQQGDRIVEVNGIRGTPNLLMQALQDNTTLEVVLSRPAA